MSFPKDFVWGAASASYQVEGGAFEDGKGLSIWDAFSHFPGKIYGDQNGDKAADAYHRFEEDLDLMRQMGIRHYRFSLSWPRIFPDGTVQNLNPAGLDYYDRLVDGCLARGITPWVTLYHWDLPLALFHRGGWLNRKITRLFADYAGFIAEHFRGRVSRYITINEPQCIVGMGTANGLHAPGLHYSAGDQFRCWHHLMVAHGLAVRAIRAAVPDAVIGVASTGALTYLTKET